MIMTKQNILGCAVNQLLTQIKTKNPTLTTLHHSRYEAKCDDNTNVLTCDQQEISDEL